MANFKKMTQIGFFKVSQAMVTHREEIDKIRTVPEVLSFLQAKTGELVTKSSWPNICEAAGYKPGGIARQGHSDTSNSRRTLTNTLVGLYEKLGERVPDNLVALYGVCNEQPYQRKPAPIPVASIPKTTTLNIAK